MKTGKHLNIEGKLLNKCMYNYLSPLGIHMYCKIIITGNFEMKFRQ